MSASEQEPSLAPWVPKLNRYRDAIADQPSNSATRTSELSTPFDMPVESDETSLSSPVLRETEVESPPQSKPLGNDDIPVSFPSASLATEPANESTVPNETAIESTLPSIVHLPIDSLLKKLQRVKSFVLGIVSIGSTDSDVRQLIVSNLVSRCSEKTDRKALLVSIRSSNENQLVRSTKNDRYQEVFWSAYGESKAASKTWHAQLGDLPRWKQEFGLIVLDLGEVATAQMPRVGRLCDGIAVQLHDPTDARATIQSLKSLTKENLPILGAWSVGLNSRKLAA